jgi:hypothetical protein
MVAKKFFFSLSRCQRWQLESNPQPCDAKAIVLPLCYCRCRYNQKPQFTSGRGRGMGAMTHCKTASIITALSKITLSISCRYAVCHYAECGALLLLFWEWLCWVAWLHVLGYYSVWQCIIGARSFHQLDIMSTCRFVNHLTVNWPFF